MPFLSFDEKAWDKVRPSSVKKTGVSEAIRAFEKALPKTVEDLQTSAACEAARELLDAVAEKLNGAKGRFDTKKHEAEIKKVTGWLSEVAVRRKIISNHADKLHKHYEDLIEKAGAEMDPFMARAEKAWEQARTIVSLTTEKAKVALVVGAKGDVDALLQLKDDAVQLKKKFDKLRADAQPLNSLAEKAVVAKMPPQSVLDKGHLVTSKAISLRCGKIHSIVKDEIGLCYEQFQESFEAITFATTRSEGMHEKFAKVINTDLSTCETIFGEIFKGMPAIGTDLEQAEDRLKAALKRTDPAEKRVLLEEASKWVKEAILRVNKFRGINEKLSKTLESKVKAYPEFFETQRETFARQHRRIAEIRKACSNQDKELDEQLDKAKTLGSQILEQQKI